MAENRRDRDKRFYFSRGQLVVLGGAFTLASLVIFLLGIVVGRVIEERKMARPEEPLIKIPVKPSAQGGRGSAAQKQEELTFYDTLAKSSGAELSAEERASDLQQPEKAPQSEAKETQSKEREASPPALLRAEGPPAVEKSNAVQPSNTAEEKESSNAWYVQVNAFPDEKSGKVSVDRLKNKGYNAYLTEARNQGKIWYRVRVGQYSSREEAEKMADTLRSRENFPKAFATRQ
jgi:cell division septation protein DedD